MENYKQIELRHLDDNEYSQEELLSILEIQKDALKLSQNHPEHSNFVRLIQCLCLLLFFVFWTPLMVLLPPFEVLQKLSYRLFLEIARVSVVYEGLENIKEPCTIMMNHVSGFDTFLINSKILPAWVAKEELFNYPIFGRLLSKWNMIPIKRTSLEGAKESLDRAVDLVSNKNLSLAISPEGKRSPTGLLLKFKRGAFHTALKLNRPILPVIIEGAYQVWPFSNYLFWNRGWSRAQIRVRFLKPLEISSSDDYLSLLKRTRKYMLENLEEIPS